MRNVYLIFLALAFLGACSDAKPQVDFLSLPTLSSPSIQTSQYVDTGLVAAARAKTADLYSGTFIIRSGGPIGLLKTADQYQLTVRQVSF